MSAGNSGEEEKQGDLIEVFKIVTGREGLSPQQFLEATKVLLLEDSIVSFMGRL